MWIHKILARKGQKELLVWIAPDQKKVVGYREGEGKFELLDSIPSEMRDMKIVRDVERDIWDFDQCVWADLNEVCQRLGLQKTLAYSQGEIFLWDPLMWDQKRVCDFELVSLLQDLEEEGLRIKFVGDWREYVSMHIGARQKEANEAEKSAEFAQKYSEVAAQFEQQKLSVEVEGSKATISVDGESVECLVEDYEGQPCIVVSGQYLDVTDMRDCSGWHRFVTGFIPESFGGVGHEKCLLPGWAQPRETTKLVDLEAHLLRQKEENIKCLLKKVESAELNAKNKKKQLGLLEDLGR